jgi:RNA polymerase sigma-70 factor (ECF subfamily)
VGERSNEQILVLKAQAGDRSAFNMLYRSYHPSLIRFSYRLCRNEQMAHDAVQEAWVTTARTLSDLYDPAHFRARIFKAVRWRTLDFLRKPAEAHQRMGDEISEIAAPERPFWATQSQIIALLAKLPAAEQQAVYLFYLEELKVEEIAAVMEVPSGTIKSRLNRARRRLKEQMEGEENAID